MYNRKTTLIYFLKSMHLYHLKGIFTEIFVNLRLFILSYNVAYIVHTLDLVVDSTYFKKDSLIVLLCRLKIKFSYFYSYLLLLLLSHLLEACFTGIG